MERKVIFLLKLTPMSPRNIVSNMFQDLQSADCIEAIKLKL